MPDRSAPRDGVPDLAAAGIESLSIWGRPEAEIVVARPWAPASAISGLRAEVGDSMSRDPASEREEMALIVNRLIETLTHVHEGLATPPHVGDAWGDEDQLYLETTLSSDGDPECLDLCLHGGRLFLAAAR